MMKTRVRILEVILFFLVQSVCAQVVLETVYVSKKKVASDTPVYRYYYYPNLEVYYDVCTDLYLYKKEGHWITAAYMAPNYRGYGLYNNNYVVLEGYTEDAPYTLINDHKKKYPANFSGKRRKEIPIAQK